MIKMEIKNTENFCKGNDYEMNSRITGSVIDISVELAAMVEMVKRAFVSNGMSPSGAEVIIKDCVDTGFNMADVKERE